MDRYDIRVAGHLAQRRARSLGCDELRLLPDGDSLLVFCAVDQAALYGLLTRLRDAGLGLIAAQRVPPTQPVDARAPIPGPRREHSDAGD